MVEFSNWFTSENQSFYFEGEMYENQSFKTLQIWHDKTGKQGEEILVFDVNSDSTDNKLYKHLMKITEDGLYINDEL